MQTFAALGASPAQLLAFRGALIGWLIPADVQSLHEILRASHLLGLGNAEERGAVLRDGAGLHNWVADSARSAGFHRFDPHGHLIPPHRRLYGERMTYSADITPSELDLPGDLVRLTGAALTGNLPSGTRRERALHDWLREYGDAGMQALARLAPAHLTAIHLYSGPDYRLVKAYLNGERLGSGMGRRLLRSSVWSLTRQAVEMDAPAFLPMMLRNHPDLDELFDDMRAESDLDEPGSEVAELRERSDAMADWLYDQLPLHVDMMIEGLEILPPVGRDVWWGDRGVPGPLGGPPVDGPVYGRDTITMPFPRSTSLVRARAHEFMTWSKRPPRVRTPLWCVFRTRRRG
ncbi:hypothetical protein SAZ11_15445 [Streptomyces sp. FXJ1.4098]|nr:hypothetical protein [Streptomyces sp. FXJ1.4098]